jgi:hypothetical protein
LRGEGAKWGAKNNLGGICTPLFFKFFKKIVFKKVLKEF